MWNSSDSRSMIRYKWYSVLNDKEDVPKGIVGVEKIIKSLPMAIYLFFSFVIAEKP